LWISKHWSILSLRCWANNSLIRRKSSASKADGKTRVPLLCLLDATLKPH
jgi:hypothetical protein